MRDLKVIANYSTIELIDYLIKEFHIPIKNDLKKCNEFLETICTNSLHKDKLSLTKEVFKQLIQELKTHFKREEKELFPKIISFLNGENKNTTKLKDFLRLQKIEHSELMSYLNNGKVLLSKIDISGDENFDNLKKYGFKLYQDIIDGIFIEDNYLNPKVRDLLNN